MNTNNQRRNTKMNVATATVQELLAVSNAIRRGAQADPNDAFAVAKRLADARYIEHARNLAQHVASRRGLGPAKAIELAQKWALWTSQNPDAPDDSKHDEALAILETELPAGAQLSQSNDPETLGIAGGICKRKWLIDGQRQTLERSLSYYERGAAQGIEADTGYTAINAAFVLDLLGSQEGKDGDDRRQRARELREKVRDTLLALKSAPAWEGGPPREVLAWFWETVAEAHFGLQEYPQATAALKQAYAVREAKPWERETTARQFAWLARLQDPDARSTEGFLKSQAWGVLRSVYGGNTAAGAGSLFAGKLGLSLSGGGFRASLFHIGVLAALAERDMLRHVEVLSCVSGGSILGAHYYLEVRKLLQDKADGEITRDDYIQLVERVAREFLAGVQDNLRVRIGTNLLANLRMMLQPGYTTTSRLAELYEKHLYAHVADDKQRVLRELLIRPKQDEGCIPKYDNWRRINKVPILILNATALNTGHNWQFTATWMGEPPAVIDSRVDGNYRLRRMYLEDEAPAHRDIRISEAAAASACVPGMFTPLELRGLYPDITVRLVDGGVHDNQGMFGLLDQNCGVMIVSDASGQMSAIDQPADGPIEVLLRTISLLQARVRVASFREVESRRRSGRLKGLLFLHLKRGLEVEDRDWIQCDNPKELTADQLRAARAPLTDYGVLKRAQRLIAGIRTDLDSFSDTEAFSLMTAGCNMVRATFDAAIAGFAADRREHAWPFLQVAQTLKSEKEASGPLNRLLSVSGMTVLKVWKLSPVLRTVGTAVTIGFAALLLYALVVWRAEPLLTLKGILAAVALAALVFAAGRLGLGAIVKVIRYRKTLHQILLGTGLAAAGWLVLGLHLKFLNPLFLRYGALPGQSASTKGSGSERPQ
jgi:predicted acylesterase/phospholipase RssA